MKALTATATAAIVVATSGGAAYADTAPSMTYYFTGTCNDCSKSGPTPAQGVLSLTGYSPGQTLQSSNINSFDYSSAKYNYVDFFGAYSASGSLGAVTGAYDVSFSGKSVAQTSPAFGSKSDFGDYQFTTSTNGGWSLTRLSDGAVEDTGVNASWSTTDPAISAAPEPDAWALLVGGVAAMGLALQAGRRRTARGAVA